ncbi:uncharacterized protein BJX67DRAFT_359399 [Aspergillus lucknowensis]|uniref:SUN domain-containing protein n=1 Tax=Aspergillus lucknowensis TaxID=176173 RepID=A0ABR4LKU8_9EURO
MSRPRGGTVSPRGSEAPGSPRRSERVSPNAGVGALPHIPTKHSFAYGSSATPILPHQLAVKPKMNLEEMANTIEDAVQIAKDREISELQDSPSLSARSRRSPPSFGSPSRRPRRQPTPDEMQLLESLQDASSSVSGPERSNSNTSGISSITPPRISRHSSLGSSLDALQASTDPHGIYPPPMDREETPVPPRTPVQAPSAVDLSSSAISYEKERRVNDDDLRRTRTNITAPPRRFLGPTVTQGLIEEEDELVFPPSRSNSSTTEYLASAPVRTVIPDRSFVSPEPELYTEKSAQESWQPSALKDGFVVWFLRLLILVLVLAAMYTLKDTSGPRPSFPGVPAGANNTGLDALSNQVVKLGAQVSSLSKDMRSIRTDVSKIPAPTTIYQYPSKGRPDKYKYKTNFLSIGSGVLIDPYMTSPTAAPRLTQLQKVYRWLSGDKHYHQQPPLAALTPWEDYGECWCSATRQGMSQLAVLLGRRTVPEDVVVEHLPKAASIRPEVAPQDMELWARYRYVGKGSRPYKWSLSSFLRGHPDNIAGQDNLAPDRKILRGPVMDALRLAWRDEPDSAFSDDKLLGPDFYRIGKWTYDINDVTHIQRFPVNAIIDSDEVRVDKVVFRVNSNWGGNETCIYRLKLHGKL